MNGDAWQFTVFFGNSAEGVLLSLIVSLLLLDMFPGFFKEIERVVRISERGTKKERC
jgi:hypothetical protein